MPPHDGPVREHDDLLFMASTVVIGIIVIIGILVFGA